MIGFKEQMPGSGQWQLQTEQANPCWHCDQWIYTLIFWDAETIGRNAQKQTHHKVLNQIVKKVESINPATEHPSLVSLSIYDGDSSIDLENEQASPGVNGKKSPFKRPDDSSEVAESLRPVLYGDFTNWKPQEMMPIDDFVLLLAKKYGRQNADMHDDFPQMLDYMRKNLLAKRNMRSSTTSISHYVQPPSNDVRSYNDLTEDQQKYFDKLQKERLKRILGDWKGVLEQYLEYRKPFLVDAYHLNKPEYKGRCKNLYVFPTFLPAGKHTYLVKNKQTYEYTMHQIVADFRTEDPPVLLKELKYKQNNRIFRKEVSVFEPWKEDTELSLQMAYEADIGSSKLSKGVVKDPFQLTRIYDYIHEKFEFLKMLFLQLACHSHYPFVLQIDIHEFCHKLDLIDGNLKQNQVDICFIAANTKPKQGVVKPGISRGEFIEFLVRISQFRYKNHPRYALEGVRKLLEEDIMPKWVFAPTWMEFRNRYLWTLDVNDVFATNIFGIQKLYNRQVTIHKSWLEYQEAHYLFTLQTNLVTEYVFKICYGFSKMTVVDEATNGAQYYRLQLVEFLELIGRIAVAYWEHNREHLEEVSLARKIEFILDTILPLVNVRRNEVNIDEEENSFTDEDY